MESQQKQIQQHISEYLGLLNRGKYFLIIPVIVSVIIGSAVAFKLPAIYRSEVTMFYMQGQVPEWAELQTINMYMEALIKFVEATALSASNCMTLIEELDLYPEMEDKVPTAVLIEHMKENYQKLLTYTSVPGQAGRTEEIVTGFEFHFDHPSPQKAFEVANALASDFIKYYREFRAGFAAQTSTFFEDERQRLKEEIIQIDKEISEFKKKHLNELPELFNLNYRMVDVLNQKLLNTDQQLQQLKAQKRDLEAKLATINPIIGMEGRSGERIVTPEEKLAALKSELDILLSSYSEKYPDIIRVKKEIEKLEKVVQNRSEGRALKKTNPQNPSSPDPFFSEEVIAGAYNPTYIQLTTQLNEINLEIESLQEERRSYEKDLEMYERRVGRTPLVEKEYKILERDLDSAKNRYEELVNQVLKLESAEALEKREMGGKLTIGAPPTRPLTPVSPNRPLIIAGSVIGGLAIGVLLLLGWDFMTQTVRSSQDITVLTDLPVLSEMPSVIQKKKRHKLFSAMYARIFFVVIIAVVLFVIDTFYIKIDVLIIKILSAIREKLVILGLS